MLNLCFARGRFRLVALMLLVIVQAIFYGPYRGAPTARAQGGDKLVLAFFYPWYGPNDFIRGQMNDRPVAPYISDHQDVMERQVREAKSAGIDAFISSWQGAGTETDRNFEKLLDVAAAQGFHATDYFETNTAMLHGDVVGQLKSVLDRFAVVPAFLAWNGKPVVFFW